MNQFQKVWSATAERLQPEQQDQAKQSEEQGEDATMAVAVKISRALGRPLNKEQEKKVGPIVHYAFGALMGGVYGMLAEGAPQIKRGAGIPFGTALFATADEIAVPALGLSRLPTETPLSSHLYGLASHAVYGITTEEVRRHTRNVLRLI
jgi:putative membrane protein